MTLRSLPDSFAPETVAAIDARLDGIVRDYGVAIPLVVESGSRAWGFPSPDSDYDSGSSMCGQWPSTCRSGRAAT